VPFLEDNLAYIVLDVPTGDYFLVDPADFDAVEEVKQAYGVTGAPQAVVTTHKHWDHAGHNQRYVDEHPGIQIIHGRNEPVYAGTVGLADGETLPNGLLGGKVELKAIETPCHTAAHTMFAAKLPSAADDAVNQMIFTGDCLFEGGVGMFFEGVPAQMTTILSRMLMEYDSDDARQRCAMFFGHDYGFKNYVWAADHAFGDNKLSDDPKAEVYAHKSRVVARKDVLLAKRQAGFSNTGTLLSEEMTMNLFMVAHREAMEKTTWEEQTFYNYIRDGFNSPNRDAPIDEGMTPELMATAAISALREHRTAADAPCNAISSQLRTE